jgi:hypothetical protein
MISTAFQSGQPNRFHAPRLPSFTFVQHQPNRAVCIYLCMMKIVFMRRPSQIALRLVASALRVASALSLATALFGQVDFLAGADQISVAINGKPFTDFYLGQAFPKPFLHPLRSADGRIVTRQFPMVQVEGESRDHPHHRGLFIGYGSINGINFWENENAYSTTNRGAMVRRGGSSVVSDKRTGSIHAVFEWRDPAGRNMLDEDRTMTFYAESDLRTIDFDFTLTARQDLHFEDTKEGFFAIRVADSIKEEQGGQMVSSTGLRTEKQIWGTKADWVDYAGLVNGRPVGIAIFDNPANRNHPPRWHARAYGLFALNPWGQKEFDKTAAGEGGLKLTAGDKLRLRYRVLIHDSPMTPDELNEAYRQYSKTAK